jgi:rhodanese-related sulfurtransferase
VSSREQHGDTSGGGILPGAAIILVAGALLGIGFNGVGLAGGWSWAIPWVGASPLEQLESVEDLATWDDGSAPYGGGYEQITDPMAVGLGAATDLPQVQELDRPVQIGIDALKRLYDAGAVVVVDAREPEEYAAGHIAGAINLPFDEVSVEPERLEGLDPGGRPIAAYCGGGTCEVSLSLAWDLLAVGHTRVVVYVGGYAEWAAAGHPVRTGDAAW